MKQQKLGAVYLELNTLDRNYFRSLIEDHNVEFEGLDFYLNNDEDSFIENCKINGTYSWLSTNEPEEDAELIDVDELSLRLM